MSAVEMPEEQEDRRPAEIARLNDMLRTTLGLRPGAGRVVVTPGVHALPAEERKALLMAVATFDAYDAGDDPYAERDMGCVFRSVRDVDGVPVVRWSSNEEPEIEGGERERRAFFKFDYYAKGSDMFGSEDPADPDATDRVMTVMLGEEY